MLYVPGPPGADKSRLNKNSKDHRNSVKEGKGKTGGGYAVTIQYLRNNKPLIAIVENVMLVDLKHDTLESDYVLDEIRGAGYFCIRHKNSAETTGSRCVGTRFFNNIDLLCCRSTP